MSLEDLRAKISSRLAVLSRPLQLLVVVLVFAFVGILFFWLFNQIFYYYLAKSYAEELADAYDLNKFQANAILWISFGCILFFAKYLFSLSQQKRIIGTVGVLLLLAGHSLLVWRGVKDDNFTRTGQAAKCYVLTRSDYKILNRLGFDPESGRECRPLNSQVQEKLNEYSRGRKPVEITSGNPVYFDPLSGEPVIWYTKADGRIQIFDLMGFHPVTGQELVPIDRETVDAWRKQAAAVIRRAPVPVDPNQFSPFDPISGSARIWVWKDGSGNYEFYDGPGFHPRTGEALTVIDRDVLAAWRRDLENAAERKKQEDERRTQELREKSAREAKEKQDSEERERSLRQAATDCDNLAANPTDQRRTSVGASFDVLKFQVDQAFSACTKALQQFPHELRFKYQLGRATYFKDKKRALELFSELTDANYPAAFDNLGGMLLYDRKDVSGAIRLFLKGASLGDADSMVSLADLIDRNLYMPNDPMRVKWTLLKKAADLGHKGAEKAITKQIEMEEANRQAGIVAGQLFQGILRGLSR